ncbi:hypothetical protein E1832_00840 [Antarcticimicrobium luteum]|uniref:Uncharacterized protein n=1 Tax=Antarcticimicrobium luteum TaxID=2547397 RepID=A0A4R5VIR8_9RHOB|nr:hypothetical protein E1832_00840 [Antarcticimicrobium luteum]
MRTGDAGSSGVCSTDDPCSTCSARPGRSKRLRRRTEAPPSPPHVNGGAILGRGSDGIVLSRAA